MAHFGGMDLPTILTGLLTATVCYTACLPLSSAQPMAAVAVGRCGGVLSGRRGARYRHLVRRLVNESVPAHACPRSQWVAHCGRYPARFPRPAFGPEHGPATLAGPSRRADTTRHIEREAIIRVSRETGRRIGERLPSELPLRGATTPTVPDCTV